MQRNGLRLLLRFNVSSQREGDEQEQNKTMDDAKQRAQLVVPAEQI